MKVEDSRKQETEVGNWDRGCERETETLWDVYRTTTTTTINYTKHTEIQTRILHLSLPKFTCMVELKSSLHVWSRKTQRIK